MTKKIAPIVLSVIVLALLLVTVGFASNARGDETYPGLPVCKTVQVAYPGMDGGIWSAECVYAPTPISIQVSSEDPTPTAAPMTIKRLGRSR